MHGKHQRRRERGQEMSRCRIPVDMDARPPLNRRRTIAYGAFAVGLLTIRADDERTNGSGPGVEAEDLHEAAHALQPHLRPQDVLAYIGDNTFGVIFPDLPVNAAEERLTHWLEFLGAAGTSRDGDGPVTADVRICECDARGFLGDAETVRIANAV